MRLKKNKQLAIDEYNTSALQLAAERTAALGGKNPLVVQAQNRRLTREQSQKAIELEFIQAQERRKAIHTKLLGDLARSKPTVEGIEAAIGAVQIPPGVLGLFRTPFYHDGGGYIRDGAFNVAASYTPPVPRGWGRIQYLPNGSELFDQWSTVFRTIAGDATDHDTIARLLTEHWHAACVSLVESLAAIASEAADQK